MKLWKISERERKVAEGNYNLRGDDGSIRASMQGGLALPKLVPMELIVEASPRRVYANAHTYHINSISVNSDQACNLRALSCYKINFRKLSSPQTIWESIYGIMRSQIRATVWPNYFYVLNLFLRHRGHQAYEHGGVDGGDHRCGVPSNVLQLLRIQFFKGGLFCDEAILTLNFRG